MDERRESGEFYPGGSWTQHGEGSGGSGGEDEVPRVPVTHVDELQEDYRESDMKNKINELARIVSGGVAALALLVGAPSPLAVARFVGAGSTQGAAAAKITVACFFGAGMAGDVLANGATIVQGARKDELWNSDFVVTNVTVELDGYVTTNQLASAMSGTAESIKKEVEAATNELAMAVRGDVEAASNNLATAMDLGIAAATNSQNAATDAKLTNFATRAWVEGLGYLTGSNMNSYAQMDWVQEQGYATKGWVEGKGYMTMGALTGYATLAWVEGMGYARREEIGRLVAEALSGSDERTAHRLMAPGTEEWIDGTGTVWRVMRAATWNGETSTNYTDYGSQQEWVEANWWCGYFAQTSATGYWYLVRNLDAAGRLTVEYHGNGLPGEDGTYEVAAETLTLNGGDVTPGQVTSNGWYQIGDGEGNMYYVSPLVATVTVHRVTNAVDRIAKMGGVYTKGETDTRIVELSPQGLTTNDVAYIVTNETEIGIGRWRIFRGSADVTDSVAQPVWVGEISRWDIMDAMVIGDTADSSVEGTEHSVRITWEADDMETLAHAATYTAVRGSVTSNALGLARLVDLPTNHVTKAELVAATNNINTANLATKQEVQAVSNEAQIVYRLYSGSNVVDEVTNYNSSVHLPSRRLYQLSESNTYFKVWDEMAQHSNTLAAAKSDAAAKVGVLRDFANTNFAPRAWSGTTSGLGAEAPPNTTWISTPTTVIAGGLEYAKIVHSGGTVWVLSGNGMMDFSPTNAYMRISADDGTEIFSIEKTDAMTVGAYADGITMSRGDGVTVINIPVNVVSAEHPTMYYRQKLDDAAGWISETEFHGNLGNIYWGGRSGAWDCEINMSANGTANSGFFKFTYEQPGSTLIKHNAPMDVSGGIMCTDGVHKVRPVYSNGAVTWEVVQ